MLLLLIGAVILVLVIVAGSRSGSSRPQYWDGHGQVLQQGGTDGAGLPDPALTTLAVGSQIWQEPERSPADSGSSTLFDGVCDSAGAEGNGWGNSSDCTDPGGFDSGGFDSGGSGSDSTN